MRIHAYKYKFRTANSQKILLVNSSHNSIKVEKEPRVQSTKRKNKVIRYKLYSSYLHQF